MMGTDNIKVFLADDHEVVRRGLEVIITTEKDMEVVGSARCGAETIRLLAATEADVILLDVDMPGTSGVEAVPIIKQRQPYSKILMLSSANDMAAIMAAIQAGALGFLLKDADGHELIQAIRMTHAGKAVYPTRATLKMIDQLNRPVPTPGPLTEREAEILRYVARGLGNQEIADLLVVSERTVRTHISKILGKLKLSNRTQATLYALRQGIALLGD